MAEKLKSWLGLGKRNREEKMETEAVNKPEPVAETDKVKALFEVQQTIKELVANPKKYDHNELAAQLEKMSKALRIDSTDPESENDTKPPLLSNKLTSGISPQVATVIPQSLPLNARQSMNEAGGYSFKVCDMIRLKRFLILGSESGTYYATAKEVAGESIGCINRLIQNGNGLELLNVLEDYSVAGRVAKEDPILIALTACAMSSKLELQRAAYSKLTRICNIPTKLFLFLDNCQKHINEVRKTSPPKPQRNKRRREEKEETEKKKEPSEHLEYESKKKKKRLEKEKQVLKKVNTTAKKSSGWGRMRRSGVASFYTDDKKDANRLLYLLTKFKQRHNWSHKQVLGYAHPKMTGEEKEAKNLVLTYSTRGYEKFNEKAKKLCSLPGVTSIVSEVVAHINALHEISKLKIGNDGNLETLLDYMKKFGIRDLHQDFSSLLPTVVSVEQSIVEQPSQGRRSAFQIVREHIPTEFLKERKVWEALLVDMPMTALIRNLGKMSSMKLFVGEDSQKNVDIVTSALTNVLRLKKAKVHPMKILIALRVYLKGQGDKGNLQWTVNQEISGALDKAFYLSFQSPEVKDNFKTGKKFMLCLDVSGSMSWQGCCGCEQMTPAMASIAMAMVTWNIEDTCRIMAFGGHFMSLENLLSKNMTLDEAMRKTSGLNFGSTDCSLPMKYALENKLETDVFIVYTDSDTYSGRIHPPKALEKYNEEMKRDAKLIVCAMQTNNFTIADPNNPNMMDICGFDTNVPDIIAEFSRGGLNSKCNVCEDCKLALKNMKTE